VDEDDVWRSRASLRYPDGNQANRAVFHPWVQLIWARIELLAVDIGWDQKFRGDLPPILYRCMSELFRSGTIRREGSTIDIISRFRMPFTELQELCKSGELDTPDGLKKPAHR
jgi:hypothetical protein